MSEGTYESQGSLAIVTGASRGLGLQIAQHLEASGYSVISTTSKSEFIAQESGYRYLNFLDTKSVRKFVNDIRNCVGKQPLKVLINNASYDGPDFSKFPSDKISLEYLDEMAKCIRVSAWGTDVLCDELGKMMCDNAPAKIINVSAASVVRNRSSEFSIAAAKSAVNAATKIYAKKFLGKVSVNSIAPGFILTERLKSRHKKFPELFEKYDNEHELPAYLEPESLYPIIDMIINDQFLSITGQIFVADGGRFGAG